MSNLRTKYVENVNKQYFENAFEILKQMDELYFNKLHKHVLTKTSIQHLSYFANSEYIKENAYESLQPRIDAIISYYNSNLFKTNSNKNNIVLAIRHKEMFLKPIQQLKVILKRYVPSQKPMIIKGTSKGKEVSGTTFEDTKILKPVKKPEAITPKVLKDNFKIKDTDKFALPDVTTYKKLKEVDFLFRKTFIQTGIYDKLNTRNATVNYADRKKKSFESELDVYKTNMKVLKENENLKINLSSNEIIANIEDFKNYNSTADEEAMKKFYEIHKMYVALKARIKRNANISNALCDAVEQKYNKPINEIVTNYDDSITNHVQTLGKTGILTK